VFCFLDRRGIDLSRGERRKLWEGFDAAPSFVLSVIYIITTVRAYCSKSRVLRVAASEKVKLLKEADAENIGTCTAFLRGLLRSLGDVYRTKRCTGPEVEIWRAQYRQISNRRVDLGEASNLRL
jgi:hypothetical protein